MQRVDMLTINISSTTTVSEAAPIRLDIHIEEVDSLMDTWLDQYRHRHTISNGLELYWTSTALPRFTNNALSLLINFATSAVASMMIFYWTYKLELAMLREDSHDSKAMGNTGDLTSSFATNTHCLGSLIVRSTTYWLRKELVSTHVYMYIVIFPYQVAWTWFARRLQLYANEILACHAVRERILTGGSKTRVAEFVIDQLCKGPPDHS